MRVFRELDNNQSNFDKGSRRSRSSSGKPNATSTICSLSRLVKNGWVRVRPVSKFFDTAGCDLDLMLLKDRFKSRGRRGPLRHIEHPEENDGAFFKHACAYEIEGIVSRLSTEWTTTAQSDIHRFSDCVKIRIRRKLCGKCRQEFPKHGKGEHEGFQISASLFWTGSEMVGSDMFF